MRNLDKLTNALIAAKEELQKNELHDTVEGFASTLKNLPKDGGHRGQFITQHMNHGPFVSALNSHPQGEFIRNKLNQFLNSPRNAGLKPGQSKMTVTSNQAPTQPAAPVQPKSAYQALTPEQMGVENFQTTGKPEPRPMVPATPKPKQYSREANNLTPEQIAMGIENVRTTSVKEPYTETMRYSDLDEQPATVEQPRIRQDMDDDARRQMYDDAMNGYFRKSGEKFVLHKNGQWSIDPPDTPDAPTTDVNQI